MNVNIEVSLEQAVYVENPYEWAVQTGANLALRAIDIVWHAMEVTNRASDLKVHLLPSLVVDGNKLYQKGLIL